MNNTFEVSWTDFRQKSRMDNIWCGSVLVFWLIKINTPSRHWGLVPDSNLKSIFSTSWDFFLKALKEIVTLPNLGSCSRYTCGQVVYCGVMCSIELRPLFVPEFADRVFVCQHPTRALGFHQTSNTSIPSFQRTVNKTRDNWNIVQRVLKPTHSLTMQWPDNYWICLFVV